MSIFDAIYAEETDDAYSSLEDGEIPDEEDYDRQIQIQKEAILRARALRSRVKIGDSSNPVATGSK
jgi:hypothetical protein